MPGFYSPQGPITSDPGRLEDYEASLGSYIGHSFGAAVDTNPILKFGILPLRYLYEDEFGERVEAQAARDEIARNGLRLDVPDDGISRYKLDALMYLKQREITRSQVFGSRSGPVTTIAGLAAALAGGATDPINVASAFIPVVSAARYAAAARVGSLAPIWSQAALKAASTQAVGSTVGRIGVGAGVGAAEGFVGAALVEPLNYIGAQISQSEYTLMDSFVNVTLGTALGSGLHAFYAPIAFRGERKLIDIAAERLPEGKQIDVLKSGVEKVEIGVKPNPERQVSEAVMEVAGVRVSRDVWDNVLQASEGSKREIRDLIVTARTTPEKLAPESRELDIFGVIRSLGGFKTRDAQGNLVPYGREIELFLDKKGRHRIDQSRGKTPDQLREALVESGWIGKGGKDDEGNAMQELLDLVQRRTFGEKPQPMGDNAAKTARRAAEYDIEHAKAELEQAGVLATDSNEVAFTKVAAMRAARDLGRSHPAEVLQREGEGSAYDPADAPPEPDYIDPVMEHGEAASREVAERLKRFKTDEETVATIAEDMPVLQARIDQMTKDGTFTAADRALLDEDLKRSEAFKRWSEVYESAAMCAHEAG